MKEKKKKIFKYDTEEGGMFSNLDDAELDGAKSALTSWLDRTREDCRQYREACNDVEGVAGLDGYFRRLLAVCAAAEGKKIRVLEYGLKKLNKEIERRKYE